MPIRLMLSSQRPVIMHGREEAAWRRIDELSEMFRVSLFPEDFFQSSMCGRNCLRWLRSTARQNQDDHEG